MTLFARRSTRVAAGVAASCSILLALIWLVVERPWSLNDVVVFQPGVALSTGTTSHRPSPSGTYGQFDVLVFHEAVDRAAALVPTVDPGERAAVATLGAEVIDYYATGSLDAFRAYAQRRGFHQKGFFAMDQQAQARSWAASAAAFTGLEVDVTRTRVLPRRYMEGAWVTSATGLREASVLSTGEAKAPSLQDPQVRVLEVLVPIRLREGASSPREIVLGLVIGKRSADADWWPIEMVVYSSGGPILPPPF